MGVADIKSYIPVKEAARILSRDPRTVQRYVAKGYLHAERIAGRLLINRDELYHFTPPEPGNPLLKRRNV